MTLQVAALLSRRRDIDAIKHLDNARGNSAAAFVDILREPSFHASYAMAGYIPVLRALAASVLPYSDINMT